MADKDVDKKAEEQNEQHPDSRPAQREDLIEDLATRRPWTGEEPEMQASEEDDDVLEVDDDLPEEGEPEPDAEPTLEADAEEEGDLEPEPEPAPEPVEPDDSLMVRVKIDGVEREMSYGEMKRSVQLEQTARQRLEEANRMRAELEAGKAETLAEEEEPEPEQEDVDFNDLARSLQYEDPEVAAEKLRDAVHQIQQSGNAPAVDEEQMRASITADVQNQLEWQNALQQFTDEYKDILADQNLASLAGGQIHQEIQHAIYDSQQTGAARPPFWDIFDRVGGQIRGWAKGVGALDQAEDSGQDDVDGSVDVKVDEEGRTARKVKASASTPRPRSRQRSARRAEDQLPNVEETRRSAIEDMMRQRGQLTEEKQE
jgi:hypothetical protein